LRFWMDTNSNTVSSNLYGVNCTYCTSLILNSILWNNSTDQIYSIVSDQPQVGYSDIQGGFPGDGNIDADPLFVDMAQGFTYKSDYLLETTPNGRRINIGAYGGSPLAANCPCDGDFGPDGDIDGQDLLVFMADFNRTDCVAAGGCAGDFDFDGDVDSDDLEAFAANFGKPDCLKQSGVD
jgi:hypothetical protein